MKKNTQDIITNVEDEFDFFRNFGVRDELASFEHVTCCEQNCIPREFVQTKELDAVVEHVITGFYRKRINNFFICTKSQLFSHQMAEYLAFKFSKNSITKDYIVLKLNYIGETFTTYEFDLFMQYVKANKFKKVVLFVENFDKSCLNEEVPYFFRYVRYIKETLQIEELKCIFTIGVTSNFEYDDSLYDEYYMRYDIVGLEEPNLKQYNEVLEDCIKSMFDEYAVKFSANKLKYFWLMYNVYQFENHNMNNYLDILDSVLANVNSEGRNLIKKADIKKAFEMIHLNTGIIDKKIQNDVAYHEAGHCIVGMLLFGSEFDLSIITNIPCDDNNGITIAEIKSLETIIDEEICYKEIAYLLGGTVAEELIGIPINSGASGDFEDAMYFVKNWLMTCGGNEKIGKYCSYTSKKISNKKKRQIEEEAQKMIHIAYDLAKEILTENQLFLEMLAEKLKEKRVLSEREVKKVYKHYKKIKS